MMRDIQQAGLGAPSPTIARTLAHAFAGGNPGNLSRADVAMLVAAFSNDDEIGHGDHVHPRIDTLGSMCPVCEPETYATIINNGDAEHAAYYHKGI